MGFMGDHTKEGNRSHHISARNDRRRVAIISFVTCCIMSYMNTVSSFTNEELFNHCQENDILPMEAFSELVDRLFVGKCVYKRLLPGDSIGIQSKPHWAGIVMGLRQFCSSKRFYRPQEQIEEELEEWCKENGMRLKV